MKEAIERLTEIIQDGELGSYHQDVISEVIEMLKAEQNGR